LQETIQKGKGCPFNFIGSVTRIIKRMLSKVSAYGRSLGVHQSQVAYADLGHPAVVQVDAPVCYKVLETLGTIEALTEAKPVKLPEAGF